MAWTTPRTWVAGETLTAALLNTHLRDNMNVVPIELGTTEFTANVTVSATTEAGATTVVTAPAITFDGTTVALIEFFAPYVDSSAAPVLTFVLYDGAASIGIFGGITITAASNRYLARLTRRLTPSNAAHTYSIRAFVSSGTAVVNAGAGGVGVNLPGFIKVTRAGV